LNEDPKLAAPRDDAASGAEGAGSWDGVGARIEEIRSLERKLVGLKRDLILKTYRSPAPDLASGQDFLILRSGGSLLATTIDNVDEVVQMPQIEALPEPVKAVAGMVNYHGDLIAVVDLADLIGAGASEVKADQALVICSVEPRRVALMVDEAVDVLAVEADAVSATDEVMPGVLKATGVLRLPEGTALIIDLAWLALGAELAKLLGADGAAPIAEPTP